MLKENAIDFTLLAQNIKLWGQELGFQEVGIASCDTSVAIKRLNEWLNKGFHADMAYMKKNLTKRQFPNELHQGTLRIISVRMNYLPYNDVSKSILNKKNKAFIARYALGADYHKLIRKRLQQLACKIELEVNDHQYRSFADSAPILERAIAANAGLGWIGKNTMLINRNAGSYFFLGELFTNLPLPTDSPTTAHCGSCTACISICPTQAIVAPYQLDARRCISYLTIENKGPIPIEFRKAMGNRIFGCDDCQLICPWNKYAKPTTEAKFKPRHQLTSADLIDLFQWSETDFKQYTAGSAIKRTGYTGWLRNIAIALGNADSSPQIISTLKQRSQHPDKMIREHVQWALEQHAINQTL